MGNFYNLETARKVDFRPALFNFQLSSAFEHVQQVVQVFLSSLEKATCLIYYYSFKGEYSILVPIL